MLKYLPILLILLLFVPGLVLAQDPFGTGYMENTNLPTTDARNVVINLINVLLGVLALITFIGIIYGGFMVMTAGGDSDRAGKGGKIVSNFLIGLIIIFLAYAITNFVFTILTDAT